MLLGLGVADADNTDTDEEEDSDDVGEIITLLGEQDMLCKLFRLCKLIPERLLISLTLTLRWQDDGALSCLAAPPSLVRVEPRTVSQKLDSRRGGLVCVTPKTALRWLARLLQ